MVDCDYNLLHLPWIICEVIDMKKSSTSTLKAKWDIHSQRTYIVVKEEEDQATSDTTIENDTDKIELPTLTWKWERKRKLQGEFSMKKSTITNWNVGIVASSTTRRRRWVSSMVDNSPTMLPNYDNDKYDVRSV